MMLLVAIGGLNFVSLMWAWDVSQEGTELSESRSEINRGGKATIGNDQSSAEIVWKKETQRE
jgi:hypothetical protein